MSVGQSQNQSQSQSPPPDPPHRQPTDALSLITATWEQRMGQTVTPLLLGMMREALRHHGAHSICEAIETAAEANAPRWAYVKGILRNWQNEGRRNGAAAHSPPLAPENTTTELIQL